MQRLCFSLAVHYFAEYIVFAGSRIQKAETSDTEILLASYVEAGYPTASAQPRLPDFFLLESTRRK